jgi:hypothetical protein
MRAVFVDLTTYPDLSGLARIVNSPLTDDLTLYAPPAYNIHNYEMFVEAYVQGPRRVRLFQTRLGESVRIDVAWGIADLLRVCKYPRKQYEVVLCMQSKDAVQIARHIRQSGIPCTLIETREDMTAFVANLD